MMNPAAAALIETRNLTMRFGGVIAVNNVDFSVSDGELRCLIGPNGAGKSTFFKCLTRQYRASSGEILFGGHPITRAEPHQVAKRGIGIKTQVPSVFDGLTVRENVWLAARRQLSGREAHSATAEIIERLSLGPLADRLVGHLSHGQRQWVEMAMITSSRPKLVLLDEPTAGMSREEVERTADLIREVNRVASLIVVEHDMQFIRSIAKTVTVFHQGRIVAEDEVGAVLRNPLVRDIYLGKPQGGADA